MTNTRLNIVAKTLFYFFLAGLFEIGGGYLIWLWLREDFAFFVGLLGGAAYSAAKAASYNMMRGINAELNAKGIRASTIMPAEVDTPILNNRPHNPDAAARATMMMPEDVAAAILLCATLPGRTVIEEIVMSPTQPRDRTLDIEAATKAGSSDE